MPDVVVARRGGLETRWPCPVCLGVAMEKATARGVSTAVTLDVCPRCGGIWFERGEARQLARQSPESLWNAVPRRTEPVRPPCHGCGAPLDRDADRCAACGHRNVLRCPVCDVEMDRRREHGLVLDLCRRCEGVWFDHAELTQLWRVSALAVVERAKSSGFASGAATAGGEALAQSLFWAPDLVVQGASAATHVAGAAVQGLGSLVSSGAAAEAATSAFDFVGHAAEGVFSLIAEIIAGLFDGA
jgi:Zn-finger nucleic acid-binding protein